MRFFARAGNRRVRFPLLLLALACLGFLGCGRPMGSVSGTVKYKGKLLPYGNVSFFGADGDAAAAEIKDDGTYNIPRVPVGPVKVTVVCIDPAGTEAAKAAIDKMRSQGGVKPPNFDPNKYIKIPTVYGDMDKSGLTFTVEPGANTYNIDLK
jgi:hypothetical protein